MDSPLTLANAKARELARLLDRLKAFRGDLAPWVEANLLRTEASSGNKFERCHS